MQILAQLYGDKYGLIGWKLALYVVVNSFKKVGRKVGRKVG